MNRKQRRATRVRRSDDPLEAAMNASQDMLINGNFEFIGTEDDLRKAMEYMAGPATERDEKGRPKYLMGLPVRYT